MRRRLAAVVAAVWCSAWAAACAREERPDAYGNVEATEVAISAEAGGRLVTYTVEEGDTLAAGAVVGTIDARQVTLEREQLRAQQAATASRVQEVAERISGLEAQREAAAAQRDAALAQRGALVAQHEIAKRGYDRTSRLRAEEAATAQQLDAAEREYRVLGEQIRSQDQQIKAYERQIDAHEGQIQAARAEQQTIRRQVATVEAQEAQVAERISKAEIRNPLDGTVLTSYVETGEYVQVGQPLYKIANLASVEVRAYVTEPQLTSVKLGGSAQVSFDVDRRERASLPGTISWISSQAEFTPTPIQTRDERADLVYAVKISVANPNGTLKIGMPVDVELPGSGAAR